MMGDSCQIRILTHRLNRLGSYMPLGTYSSADQQVSWTEISCEGISVEAKPEKIGGKIDECPDGV